MRFGICTSIDNLASAEEAEYDFAELSMGEMLPLTPETAFAPVRQKLRSSSIPIEACNCFLPATLKVVGPACDLLAVNAYMEIALHRAADVGASIVVFGSAGARQAPDGFPPEIARRQFTDAVRLSATHAAPHGITIVIEPLCAAVCNVMNSELEGAQLVEEIGHPQVRLLADSYHMHRQHEPFANLYIVAKHLAHIHFDSVSLPMPEGGYEYDAPAFFGMLARDGYQARLSLEDNSGHLCHIASGLPLVEAFFHQLAIIKEYWANIDI